MVSKRPTLADQAKKDQESLTRLKGIIEPTVTDLMVTGEGIKLLYSNDAAREALQYLRYASSLDGDITEVKPKIAHSIKTIAGALDDLTTALIVRHGPPSTDESVKEWQGEVALDLTKAISARLHLAGMPSPVKLAQLDRVSIQNNLGEISEEHEQFERIFRARREASLLQSFIPHTTHEIRPRA
jgi:hypothetical protein